MDSTNPYLTIWHERDVKHLFYVSQKNFIFIHSTSSFTVDIKYWAGGLRKGIYLFKFSFQCQHFPAIFPNNKKRKRQNDEVSKK